MLGIQILSDTCVRAFAATSGILQVGNVIVRSRGVGVGNVASSDVEARTGSQDQVALVTSVAGVSGAAGHEGADNSSKYVEGPHFAEAINLNRGRKQSCLW